jgi:hypothetical protein
MVAAKQISDGLTPIADIAKAWGVSEKTISNWCEFVYQSFEVMLPVNGPYPQHGVELLKLCGKHISEKASLYHAETGEKRRLRGTEFVQKMRKLRTEGHFQEFTQFQQNGNFQNFQPEEAEDNLLAELGSIARTEDDEISRVYRAIDATENQRIEELATFIEEAPQRKMGKLVQRLQAAKAIREARSDEAPSLSPAVDVTYRQLP